MRWGVVGVGVGVGRDVDVNVDLGGMADAGASADAGIGDVAGRGRRRGMRALLDGRVGEVDGDGDARAGVLGRGSWAVRRCVRETGVGVSG